MVFPRRMRSKVLEAVKPPGAISQNLGTRTHCRSEFHLRQSVLVVQHVFVGGLFGYTSTDVSRRWPQDSRHLYSSSNPAIRITNGVGELSPISVLGSGNVDCVQ